MHFLIGAIRQDCLLICDMDMIYTIGCRVKFNFDSDHIPISFPDTFISTFSGSKLIWSEGEGPYFTLFEGDDEGSDPRRIAGYPQVQQTELFTYSPKNDAYFIAEVARI